MHREREALYFVCCCHSSSLLDSFFGPELLLSLLLPSLLFHSSLRAPPSWCANRHHGCVTNINLGRFFSSFPFLSAVSAHEKRAPPHELKHTNKTTKRQSRFFLLPWPLWAIGWCSKCNSLQFSFSSNENGEEAKRNKQRNKQRNEQVTPLQKPLVLFFRLPPCLFLETHPHPLDIQPPISEKGVITNKGMEKKR